MKFMPVCVSKSHAILSCDRLSCIRHTYGTGLINLNEATSPLHTSLIRNCSVIMPGDEYPSGSINTKGM